MIQQIKLKLERRIIDILACPDCKGDLEILEEKIVCKKCKREYFINEKGIPIFI